MSHSYASPDLGLVVFSLVQSLSKGLQLGPRSTASQAFAQSCQAARLLFPICRSMAMSGHNLAVMQMQQSIPAALHGVVLAPVAFVGLACTPWISPPVGCSVFYWPCDVACTGLMVLGFSSTLHPRVCIQLHKLAGACRQWQLLHLSQESHYKFWLQATRHRLCQRPQSSQERKPQVP